MQKYIKRDLSEIRYFEDDIDVSDWIDLTEYRLMTPDEIDRHENPEKYLTNEEKAQLARKNMPDLTPIEFDLRLRKAGLLQTVRDYVSSNEVMEIAYTRATYFRRTDPFIETARQALELTNEQVDTIWMNEI